MVLPHLCTYLCLGPCWVEEYLNNEECMIPGLNVVSGLSFLICKVGTVHALLFSTIIVWIK